MKNMHGTSKIVNRHDEEIHLTLKCKCQIKSSNILLLASLIKTEGVTRNGDILLH